MGRRALRLAISYASRMRQHRPATRLIGQTGREIALGGVHGEMVNQGPDRRRQATPGRKDDVKDTLLAAPIREHMDELAIAERLPADMAPRDLETPVCARGAK